MGVIKKYLPWLLVLILAVGWYLNRKQDKIVKPDPTPLVVSTGPIGLGQTHPDTDVFVPFVHNSVEIVDCKPVKVACPPAPKCEPRIIEKIIPARIKDWGCEWNKATGQVIGVAPDGMDLKCVVDRRLRKVQAHYTQVPSRRKRYRPSPLERRP